MVYSTGIDLVEIIRIKNIFDRFGDRFLNRYYSPDEIKIIRSRKAGQIPTLAGKFAAKEAVMTALGSFFDGGVRLRDIEILNSPAGVPYIRMARPIADKMGGKKIDISVTHEKKFAVAMAIISDEAPMAAPVTGPTI